MLVGKEGYKPFWERDDNWEITKYYDFTISQEDVDSMNKIFLDTDSVEAASKVMSEKFDFPHAEICKEKLTEATMRIVGFWSRIFTSQK